MNDEFERLWARCQKDTPNRRTRVYGAFLLPSFTSPDQVSRLLQSGQRRQSYRQLLGFLHRDYVSIFSDESAYLLQPELRDEMRQRLLSVRREPEVRAIIETLLHNQQKEMERVEATMRYPDLRSYVRDRQWTRHFLELLEAHFWQNPTETLAMMLPIFFGSSLYQPELLSSIYELVAFFEEYIAYPQSLWWEQICAGFNLREPDLPPGQKAQSLQEIRKLLSRGRLSFSGPFSSYQQTFLAALWWQEGEVFRAINLPSALPCYHEALNLLFPEKDLPEHRARLYWLLAQDTPDSTLKKELLLKCIADDPDYVKAYARLGELFYYEKDYKRALKYFYYALELDPHRIEVWVTVGVIHIYANNYPRALAELNKAITLNSLHHCPYYNRADVYRRLHKYQEALEDYTRALKIDPTFADAYINRGNIYAMLKQPEKARMDYEEARRLQPGDAEALWLSEWIAFGKERITTERAQRLYAIAEENPDYYLAPLCRGIFTGITQRDLKLASDTIETACALEPEQADPYFWLAMLLAYRNLQGQAHAALQRALDLGLPIALLQPLYWLEKDAPDFFQTYARPILQRYRM